MKIKQNSDNVSDNVIQKKGQAMVFIIIGLVLLIIIVLAVVFFQSQNNIEIDDSFSVIQSQLNNGRHASFLQTCLEQTTIAGIVELSENGGTFIIQDSREDLDIQTINGIKKGLTYSDDVNNKKKYGTNTLTPLCRKGTGCYSDATLGLSIEELLESYVKENIIQCFNQVFTEINDFNLQVNQDDIKIDANIKTQNVFVNMNADILLFENNLERKFTINEFNANIPLRFRKLHEISYNVIESEIRDLNFEMEKDESELVNCHGYCLDNNIEIKKDKISNNYIYTIHDEASLVEGEPLRFSFAIDNRPPEDIGTSSCHNFIDPDDDESFSPGETEIDGEICHTSYEDGEYIWPR